MNNCRVCAAEIPLTGCRGRPALTCKACKPVKVPKSKPVVVDPTVKLAVEEITKTSIGS